MVRVDVLGYSRHKKRKRHKSILLTNLCLLAVYRVLEVLVC